MKTNETTKRFSSQIAEELNREPEEINIFSVDERNGFVRFSTGQTSDHYANDWYARLTPSRKNIKKHSTRILDIYS